MKPVRHIHHSNFSLKDLIAKDSRNNISNIDRQLKILSELKEIIDTADKKCGDRLTKNMLLGRTYDEELRENIIKTYLKVFENFKEFIGETICGDKESDCRELIDKINKELHENKESYIEKACEEVKYSLVTRDYSDSIEVMSYYAHADAHNTHKLYKDGWKNEIHRK